MSLILFVYKRWLLLAPVPRDCDQYSSSRNEMSTCQVGAHGSVFPMKMCYFRMSVYSKAGVPIHDSKYSTKPFVLTSVDAYIPNT